MLKTIYLLLPFFICLNLTAQIESNEFFEVFLTVEKESHVIYYLDKGYFVINPIDLSQQAFLMDTLGNRIDLPCNKLERKKIKDGSDALYCFQDTMVGLFSISKNELISARYESIHLINKNFYSIRKGGEVMLYNSDDQLLLELDTDEDLKYVYQSNGDHHVVTFHENKRFIVNFMGEIVDKYPFSPNSNTFSGGVSYFIEDEKYGLKSAKGETIIPAEYEYIQEWKSDQYIVSFKTPFTQDEQLAKKKTKTLKGIFDTTKKELVLPLEFESIYPYEYGLICIKPNCKMTLLDHSFENVYEKEFNTIKGTKSGFILLKNDNGTYYDFVYDSLGWVLKDDIESGRSMTDQILKLKFKNGNSILVNRLGEVVFDPKDENASFKKLNNNYIECKVGKGKGVLNEKGEWVVEPGKITLVSYRELGGILVKDQSKKTSVLLNSLGEEIATEIQHASIIYPKNAYILSKNKKLGVIDDEGKTLIPFKFQRGLQEFRTKPGFYFIKDEEFAYLVKIKK